MQEEEARAKANSHLALKAVLTFIMPYIGGYFLINKNVKKGYRVAAIVWCILLACIAAPRSSTVGSSVIGTLMCLAPIAVYAIREKAWLWKEANSEVKITSVVLVVVLVFLLVSAVARGDRQPAQTESPSSASTTAVSTQKASDESSSTASKKPRNGFDENTYTVEAAGVEFRIPSYYAVSRENGGEIMLTIKESGTSSGILYYMWAPYKSEVSLSSMCDLMINSVKETLTNSNNQDLSFENKNDWKSESVAGLPTESKTGDLSGGDAEATLRVVAFDNKSANVVGTITFVENSDSQYDYFPDFEKIIASASIAADEPSSSSAEAEPDPVQPADPNAEATDALNACLGKSAKDALAVADEYGCTATFVDCDGTKVTDSVRDELYDSAAASALVEEADVEANFFSGKPEATFKLDRRISINQEDYPEFSEVLSLLDPGDPIVESFAAKYDGKVIEFDGCIKYCAQSGEYKTRFDYLIGSGDYVPDSARGPNFKIKNAGLNDMHWTGDVPDYVSAGTNVHVVARIVEYNRTQQLLFIEPIMTSVR